MHRLVKASLVWGVLLGGSSTNWAEETAKPASPAPDLPPANDARGDVATWIQQLEDDDFVVREAAEQHLIAEGWAVVEQVARAAQSENLETSRRAFSIFDKWQDDDSHKTRSASREALEKLAAGSKSKSATEHAIALLRKPRVAKPVWQTPFLAPLRDLDNKHVSLALHLARHDKANGRTVRISKQDGRKSLEIEERKIKVQFIESEAEGFRIICTKKDEQGNEKTTEYAAENLEALAKTQPAGFRLYEKFNTGIQGLSVRLHASVVRDEEILRAAKERKEQEKATPQASSSEK